MLLLNLFLIVGLADYSLAWCIPCIKDGISMQDYFDCPCSFMESYDMDLKKCVNFTACPTTRSPSLFSGVSDLLPDMSNLLENLMGEPESMIANVPGIKDWDIQRKAFKNRYDIIQKKLPTLVLPILAPMVAKNRSIIKKCEGDTKCLFMEAISKPENIPAILEQLPTLLKQLRSEMSKFFDDLKYMSEDCTYTNACPYTRLVVDVRTHFHEIAEHLGLARNFGRLQELFHNPSLFNML